MRVEEAAGIRGFVTEAGVAFAAAATLASSFLTESLPMISARSAGIGPLSCHDASAKHESGVAIDRL